jgi:hypothetical protein
MSERTINREKVHEEHLAEVNAPAHWAYLIGVVGGGLLVMLGFIAWLGGS